MRKIFIVSVLLFCTTTIMAQDVDSTENKNIRKGWTFGALPSVSFDADYGFQYGALTNIYYFGTLDYVSHFQQKLNGNTLLKAAKTLTTLYMLEAAMF